MTLITIFQKLSIHILTEIKKNSITKKIFPISFHRSNRFFIEKKYPILGTTHRTSLRM